MNAAIIRKQRKDEKQEQAWLLHVAPSKTTIIADGCWLWEARTSGNMDEPRKCWWVYIKREGHAPQGVFWSVDRETALGVGQALVRRLRSGEAFEAILARLYKDARQFVSGAEVTA